jgi:hypothetical protein
MFDFAWEMVQSNMERWIATFQNGLDRCMQILTYEFMTPTLKEMLNTLTETSQMIALILVVIYWLMGFVEEITEIDWRHLSMWWYIKKIIQLILAKALIDYSPTLCEMSYNFIRYVLEMFKLTFNQNDILNNINWDAMMKTVKDMSITERIMFNAEMMIPGYIIQGVGLFLQGVAIVRMINIAMLQVIAPFKLALCSKYGTKPAWEFLGRYASTVGQNVIIMIAIQVYTALVNEIILVNIQGTADLMIKIVLSSVVLVVTVLSAQSFAKFLVER